jgi:hypothetical protein
MKNEITTVLNVKKNQVGVLRVNDVDYISLTDLAKYQNASDPSFTVKNWLRRISTIDYIGLWEQLSNDNFNLVEFDQIKTEYGRNSFSMSPTQWIKRTNAIGFVSKGGRYSIGTFSHPDIAFEFASWLSSEFKLYLIKEFERLKINEAYQQKIEWNVRRLISKSNYRIHPDAIKDTLILPMLTKEQINYTYASEADVLNVALFGMTAKEWRNKNSDKKGNIRDYATIEQLIVLSNMESSNSMMIRENIPQNERLIKLNEYALIQLQSLQNNTSIKKLKRIETKMIQE